MQEEQEGVNKECDDKDNENGGAKVFKFSENGKQDCPPNAGPTLAFLVWWRKHAVDVSLRWRFLACWPGVGGWYFWLFASS